MNIAITMIEPTASKAATAAIAATTTKASPSAPVRMPSVWANPSSNVDSLRGRQRMMVNATTKSSVNAMRGSSGGNPASALRSHNEDQPSPSSQIRLSRLPKRACSTSICTVEVSDCSSKSTPAANIEVKTTPMAAPGSILPRRRMSSISTTATSAATPAPSIIGTAATTPVTRNATTIPGSTTCEIASPIRL